MVDVSLKVEHVPLKLVFLLLLIFEHFREAQIFLGLLVIDVACIVTSRVASVLAPLHQTKPAEAMAAGSTGHMVASLVLFSEALALRARLRVGLDPGNILTRVSFFSLPKLNLFAGGRLVVFSFALEAVGVSAFAGDYIKHTKATKLYSVLTALPWTPLQVSVSV